MLRFESKSSTPSPRLVQCNRRRSRTFQVIARAVDGAAATPITPLGAAGVLPPGASPMVLGPPSGPGMLSPAPASVLKPTPMRSSTGGEPGAGVAARPAALQSATDIVRLYMRADKRPQGAAASTSRGGRLSARM